MQFRLKIAGLTIAGVCLGLILGKTIGTTPRYFGDDAPAAVRHVTTPDEEAGLDPDRHDTDSYDAESEYPNHYAMVTRSGRIEVAELSMYVRNRRYWRSMGLYDGWYAPPAYDAAFEREMAAARAQLEAEIAAASGYDPLGDRLSAIRQRQGGDGKTGVHPGEPGNEAEARRLPLDIRGVMQTAQEVDHASSPALTPAAEALIASSLRR